MGAVSCPRTPDTSARMVVSTMIGIDEERIKLRSMPMPGATSRPGEETRTWLFQANPDKYDIFETLQLGEELWNLRQHAREVRVGDRVLIWVCGDDAGIYAVGRVVT